MRVIMQNSPTFYLFFALKYIMVPTVFTFLMNILPFAIKNLGIFIIFSTLISRMNFKKVTKKVVLKGDQIFALTTLERGRFYLQSSGDYCFHVQNERPTYPSKKSKKDVHVQMTAPDVTYEASITTTSSNPLSEHTLMASLPPIKDNLHFALLLSLLRPLLL